MSSWLLWAVAALFSIVVTNLLMKFLASKGDFFTVFFSPANLAPVAGVVLLSSFTAFAVFNAMRDSKINPGVVGAVIGTSTVFLALAGTIFFPEASLKPLQIAAILLAVASVALLAL